MQKNTVLFVIIAVLAGFIAGFMVANSLNRSELAALRSQSAQPVASNQPTSQTSGPADLSPAEIKSKIADADKNAGNFEFQKGLGTALYRYASMKGDVALLLEVQRILERANSLNGRDVDTVVALGNTYFDIAYPKKDAVGFQKARDMYTKALQITPGDNEVTTDLGLTYFMQEPPVYDKAAVELKKVSDANPNHERSLQFLVQVYLKQNKLPEAEKAFEKLKSANPGSQYISELSSQIAAAKGGAK